jgi:hypothetical protein
MHKRDSWAGVNGQVTKGRCPRTWAAFRDCLELHKFTVFTANAAKRQRFCIQQAVCKPQRATVQQHILQMGVLNATSDKETGYGNMGFGVDKCLKIDKPLGNVYLSTEARPIKVVDTAPVIT